MRFLGSPSCSNPGFVAEKEERKERERERESIAPRKIIISAPALVDAVGSGLLRLDGFRV